MRFRAAQLAAVAIAIAAGAAAGCRRSTLAESADPDAGPNLATDGPLPGDGGGRPADAPLDAPRDTAADAADSADHADTGDTGDHDARSADGPANLGNDDASADIAHASDARTDAADDAGADATDTAADTIDTAADLSTGDTPEDDAAPDCSGADASDVRPENQLCGPSSVICWPFVCDVARGVCKTTCASNDDCVSPAPCVGGRCGLRLDPPCSSNAECASGFCAQGVCCQTACWAPCQSCALVGSVGSCTPVPSGAPDPHGTCAAGNRCDGRGACLAAACTTDTECGPSHWCTGGHCELCAATCVQGSECPAGICVVRNNCSYCAAPGAGAG